MQVWFGRMNGLPAYPAVMRIALASCVGRAKALQADALLVAALRKHAVHAQEPDWLDTGVPWKDFDAVFVRTTWTWTKHPREFAAWLRKVDRQTRLFNSLDVLQWGLSKHYLPVLAARGVPAVPTLVLSEPDAPKAIAFVRSVGATRVIAKAALGAGAMQQHLVDATVEALAGAWKSGWPIEGDAIVQPYLPDVATRGELSVVMIEGEVSHAARKLPKSGDYRVQAEYGATTLAEEPSDAACDIARACIKAMPQMPLVARIDLVEDAAGKLAVMECEVVEPELFWPQAPHAAEKLAAALVARLQANR